MRRRTLLMGLILVLAGGMFAGCGNGKKTTTADQGSVYVLLGDAPVGDVLTARMSFTTLDLLPVGSSIGGATLPTSLYIRANVADLRDSLTILSVATLETATYDRAQIDFGITALKAVDLSQDPPIITVSPALAAEKPIFNIQPPLVLTKKAATAVHVDFDMVRSLAVDAQGQLTGTVNPVFNVTTVTPSTEGHLADFDNLAGFVRSVTLNPATPDQAYVGNFLLQLLSSTGTALYVNVNADTVFYPTSSLADLLTGSVVELQGYIDESGNLVAKTVEVEGRADVYKNTVAFFGTVLRVTRDLSGRVTGLTLFATDVEPESSSIGLYWDKLTPVDTSTATTFQYTAREVNETASGALLPFDPTAITPGQQLSVFGSYEVTTNPDTEEKIANVTAQNVYLRLQAVQGVLVSVLRVGPDDKTGAFVLTPASSLLRQGPVIVFTNATNSGTRFIDLAGLSALAPDHVLLARGLVFYVPQATTIDSVPVPAGTTVVLAKQLRRLR